MGQRMGGETGPFFSNRTDGFAMTVMEKNPSGEEEVLVGSLAEENWTDQRKSAHL